jgi:hypothetical protein
MKALQIAVAAFVLVCNAQTSLAQNNAAGVAAILKGASIIAQDGKNTFLGKIDNEFAKDSIFNEFSEYGNEFNADSIFNEFGGFGGEFSQFSPFNEFTAKPPMIVKDGNVIGYLTANTAIRGGISVPGLMSIKSNL